MPLNYDAVPKWGYTIQKVLSKMMVNSQTVLVFNDIKLHSTLFHNGVILHNDVWRNDSKLHSGFNVQQR